MSIRLMSLVWDIPFPTPSQKLILLKLADYAADAGGSVFPAVNTVAVQAGCDERTVQRVLKAFRKCGLIELVREGGTGPKATNEWRLNVGLIHSLSAGESTITGSASELEIDVSVKGDSMGDNLPGVDGLRVTNDALRVTPVSAKGDTRVTQPFTNHHIDTSSRASAPASQSAARSTLEGTGPNRAAFILTERDVQWTEWLSEIEARGSAEMRAAAVKAGSITVESKWPKPTTPLPRISGYSTKGKMAAAGSDA